MITKKDLKNLVYLQQEIARIENLIKNYKPAEVVADSVKGSSPVFPYVEHSIRIEGLEEKKDRLTEYYRRLNRNKERLEDEKKRLEIDVAKIPFTEIRLIIKYHYIDGLTYVQVMHKMGYNAPETPRRKLERYLDGDYEKTED